MTAGLIAVKHLFGSSTYFSDANATCHRLQNAPDEIKPISYMKGRRKRETQGMWR